MTTQTSLREAIEHAADPVGVMQRVVDHAVGLIEGADGASLEVRREGEVLEYLCTSGTLEGFIGLQVPIGASLSGPSLRTGRVERCDDTETDPRVDRAATRRTGIASMLCMPLQLGDETVAVLKVSSRRPGAFQDRDALTLERLTAFLATAMTLSSELARVTTSLMADLPDGAADGRARETARFVANVMSPGLADGVDARARIEAVLQDEQRLRIVVQPVSDLVDGHVVGVEALARFDGEPERTPDRWFAEAHRVGLGAELELLAVRKALDVLEALPEQLRMSINASPDVVRDQRLHALLAERGQARVTVEITEHEAIDDYGSVVGALEAIRAAGCRIAVDDTGNGYASLNHVLSLRPDVVKIDRALTTGVDADLARQALAASLVRLAGAVGGVVIAEGVETEQEAGALLDLGVWLGQGWLLGRPVDAADLDLAPRWHRG